MHLNLFIRYEFSFFNIWANKIRCVCNFTMYFCLFRAVYSSQALIGSRCGFGGPLDGPDLSPLLSHGSLIGRILARKKRSAWKSIEIAAKLTNFGWNFVWAALTCCVPRVPCVARAAAHPWRSQQSRRAAFNLKFKCKCKQVCGSAWTGQTGPELAAKSLKFAGGQTNVAALCATLPL